MVEPKYINVSYSFGQCLDIGLLEEEFKFKWENVTDWWVKWDTLHIKVPDDAGGVREIRHELFSEEAVQVDMKRPDTCYLLDKNFDAIKE
tara:strand:+ start:682 stop:951 length:270 start_codon:yes stop_codon:yes gene_type:complete